MARRPIHKEGATVGGWTLVENLDVGGNGEAWRVRSESGELRVMKLLRPGAERYDRFKREVLAVQSLVPTGFPALPIEFAHFPERPSKADPAFYVMPEAVRIDKALADKDVPTRVDAVRQLAEALAMLLREHGRNHRDVKPANLYEYEGRYVLGDFGLITDPDPQAEALTVEGTVIGPWAFLPSEVFNPPPGMEIDWQKVDVYCLAMSLWCLVKGSSNPPRRIEPHGVTSLARQLAVPAPVTEPWSVESPDAAEYRRHIGELDTILAAATADDPAARPTLAQFALQLADWKEGIRVRNDLRDYVARSEDDEELVLRWLVAFARTDPALGLNIFEVSEPTAASPVPGLSNARFSEALDGLVEGYYATVTERFPSRGEPRHWSGVYPTYFGVERVERERIEAEMMPLLRALAKEGPIEMLSFSAADDAVTVGEVVLAGPELYFLLHYLEGASLVAFERLWETGPGVSLMYLKLTRTGRMRIATTTAD